MYCSSFKVQSGLLDGCLGIWVFVVSFAVADMAAKSLEWVCVRVPFGVPAAALPYPSHLRPVEVHRVQDGFLSSHLTRRILGLVS